MGFSKQEIFLNEDLRSGGFYELSIQVCPSDDTKPVSDYLDFIWSLPIVDGPFNRDFTKSVVTIENFRHEGLITLSGTALPFSTYIISEEEGYNWFDLCFTTAAIESLIGEEYIVWDINAKYPPVIDRFFHQTIKCLYTLHPFLLGIIDFEVSGQYYLENFVDRIIQPTSSRFFVGERYYTTIQPVNLIYVRKIEEL